MAVTLKNRDFNADYLALKDFFINDISILRNEVTSNKQLFGQILGNANISSHTSNLKENMELRRIVVNKEIIIQKLSSNKNIRKEIPKRNKTDYLTKKKC